MGNYVKVKGAETGKTYNVTAEDFSKFYDDYVANSAGATVEMYDMDGNKKSVGIADAKDMYGQGYTYWQGQHNYHAGKIRAAEARKKAAEEKAKEEEPANAVSQAKQMVKPQKPAAETAKQETPTPAAEAPKAAETTAVPKQEKKRQPLTEAEKMEMMYGSTMQNIAGTVAKTGHAIDEVKAQTKIAAKPIQADRKIKLGENRKTIETAAFNPETGKVEKQYYDEFGNKFDNRAEADLTGNLVDQHNSELYNFDAELSSAEADLERLKLERDEARAARGKTLGILHHAPGSHSTQEETKYNLEDNAYNAAIRQAEERVKNLTEERDARNGEDVGFWRGVGRAVSDGRTWDFGIGDARDMSTMLQLQSEDGLTDSQKKARQAMMESLYKSQQTEQKYSGNRDFWYRAGTTTGMMPAFMVDFAASTLTGGSSAALKVGSKVAAKVATKALGEQMVESMSKKGIKAFAKEAAKDVLTQGAGKAAAKTAARDAAKKYTANWAIKALGTTADDLLVRAPLMTNTIQVNKTFADTVGRKLGDVTRDNNGNFSFENSKSWGDAAWQGEANAIIENYSEMFGAHLDPVMTLENASKLAGTFGAKRLSELLSKGSKAGIDSAMGQTKKLFEKAGVSDYAGEVSEEYYGQLWRTMLNLDDAYIENEDGTRTNNFLNAQFHGDILGGMALSMGLISGAKAGFSAASYHKMKKDLRGYEADARVLLGDDKWDVIKATLQATTNDNIGNFIATIKNDKDLTEDDKAAVLKYTEGSMRLRGFDMGEFKQKEEESQRQQWEQPNEQAATEAGQAIASQADVMGEQPNGDVIRQESQEYRDAQQALAEANKTILSNISSLDTDGLLSDVDITAVSTEGLTQVLTALPPQLRDAVAEYISIRNVADNAAIRHQAMLDGLSNSIDEAAEKHYAANMSNTDEGLSDVVEYTDEQGQLWYVRNGLTGEVTLLTNENGEVKWVPTEDIAANAFYGQSKESALDSLRTSLQEKITQEYGLAEDQQNEQQPQAATQQGEGTPQQSETQEGEQPPTAGQQEESGFVFPQRVDEEGNNVDDFTGEGVTPENALERLRTSYGMSDEDIAAWASSWRRGLQKPGAEDAEATNAYNRAKGISEGVLSLLGQQYQEEGAAEAEAAAGGAVENATEQATEQSQVPQIPTDKNGNKLYFEGSVAPKDAVDDILADLEGDMDATETAVNDELAGAQEALNKVSQEKATGIAGIKAKKAKEKEAGAVVDYWQSVADEIATRKQTARAEKEAAIKAATEKERTAAEENGQIPDWRHDTPEAARQRGFRISEGERYDRQEKIGGIEGRESKAVFTNKDGDTKDGRLMLVDINSVQESHKGSMKNPYHFIPEAQPKDRTSSASRTDTAVNAAPENFKPELLTGDGVVYNESAPIINSRGEVIQGNGRVMTMREVYKNPESAARYKQYLKEHAAEFGLTPEDIDKMEQPILVNRVDVDDAEAIRLGQFKATDLESGGSQRIEPRETIQKMGDWFRSFINKIFNGKEDESIAQLIDKNGIEVLKHMNSRGFINNTQVETAIRDGKLTAEGKNDIMNILKHHLFDGAPSELEAMFNGMPAKAQKVILSTYLRDYEVPAEAALLGDIRASIMAYHELQQEEKFNKATTYEGAKTAISDWLRQQNMFDGVANKDKFSTFALELVAREKTLSQKALTELFNTYYDMTSKSASVGGDLFSEADTKTYTKAEAIKKLFDVDIEGSKNNDNELQGSNALAGDGRPRGKGRQGGSGNAASGESNAPGTGPADGGARTGRDGEEGTESVAEDDEAIKAIAAEITKGTGIEVVTGKKAQEALEEAEALGDDIKYQTSGEIDKQYPNWLDGTTNDNGKHSTQVAGTIGTYKKVAAWVESHLGKDVKILDASSGMGLGTRELREQGFNIEDVEPYQSEDRKKNNPATYSSYGDIKGKYDVIISNAVLNVIPDDWRTNVLHDMANRLSDGGRLFINTRKAGEEKGIKDKIELDSPREVLVKRNGKIASYQRFFTPKELKDWVEKELGDGYEVEVANEKNSGTKGLAAVVVTKKTSPETVAPIPSDNVNASVVSRDAAAKVQQNLDTTKSHYEKASNRTRGFITDVSKALGLTQHGASQYGTFVSKDGKQFTIRISNHNTRATTFDENGENEGISIVISGSRNYGIRDKENTRAHVVEFFYPKKAIERAVGKPLVSIIESIKETLDTGVYKDKTGLAKPDEVDGTTRKEFRSKNGEVYGFTDGEKIYLDTKKMKKDTPLHEYAHLWCDALRRGNPEEWEHVKSLFDSVEGLEERIKETYPELEGDALYEEMITTYSGEEGTKKLEETARKIAEEEGKTLTESSKAQGFIDKVKEALKTYWKDVADMLGIHYASAEEVADKVLADWARGMNPIGIVRSKNDNVDAARKAFAEAKKSGDESEIRRTRDELKQQLDEKYKAQHMGLVQRRNEIAKEIGKAEAEKIDKPWSEMNGEERMAVAEKNPLTEDEIRAKTSEENQDLIEDAVDYINGNSGFAQQIAYLKIYDDVRNRHENAASDSRAEDGTQLDAASASSSEGLGLGGGRERRGVDRPVDNGTSEEVAPGKRESGKGGKDDSSLLAGEQGDIQSKGGTSGMVGVPSRGAESRGGGTTGKNGNVPQREGRKSGNRPADTDAGRKSTAKQGTTWRGRTDTEIKQEAKEAKAGLKAALAEMMKRGRGQASISLIGLNQAQIEYMPELMKAVKRYGMSLIDQGIYEVKDWMKNIREGIGDDMKAIGFSDKDIDDFIEEMWYSKMPMDGETRTIAEWSSIYGKAKLREKLSVELEDKKKMQDDAEPIAVKVGDRANIEETLPFLLPQQQEDVFRAETQFFSEEHADRDHAYGKGYMFTNGTGTGKTYTGLGIAKRLVKQGKKRILFVTPSQQKVSDWIKDAGNLNLELRSLDDWAEERGTTATNESGEGCVITTFANFGANKKLLETEWDAVIYDESHRIMENKKGAETARSGQHYMITNRDEQHAFMRLREINGGYQKVKDAADRFEEARKKEVARIYKEYKESHPEATTPDIMRATQRMNPCHVNDFTPADASTFPKLGKFYKEYVQARDQYIQNVEPKLKEQAKKTWKNTKTVFLSATPFNTRENLDYAEGYLFKYPENDGRGMNGRTRFYLDHFGAAYKFRYHRLEQSTTNPEAVAKQEIAFSDYLQNVLGTMSGRIIDSPYDYSRDFPINAPDHAEDFNAAVQDAVHGRYLGSAYHKTIGDYNYGSALFETMKIATTVNRIKEHIDAGRKVVVFHRRVETKEPIKPPFAYMLELANHEIAAMGPGEERDKYIKEVTEFRNKYSDLLEWEKTLDYSMPREQLAKAFGKDNVLYFSGKESSKNKDKAVKTFNDDNSGKNIIVIQEASGKEGISLHDTTGKHQRVCITLALPQSPITALQIEGRTYRIGNKSNAIFEYPLLGLNSELMLFGEKFNAQVSTTENLALGSQARNLRDSFARGVLEHSGVVPIDQQGVGGKEFDAPKEAGDTDPFDDAVLDYYSNQKLNKRNREGIDYFPTPEPLGFKMVEWANLGDGDTALEPSAGHGAIARYVPAANPLLSIEPSQSLFTKLQLKAGGLGRKFLNDTFENFDVMNKRDVVVMNPPFGTAGATAIAHLDKAFKHLDEGGRVVAIIPRGVTDKKFDKWYGEQKNAAMRAEIALPDIVFQQAGTKVVCRVVVVDKITDPALRSKAGCPDKIDLGGHYDKIEDFFEDLRNIEVPGRIIDNAFKMQKKARNTVKELKSLKGVRVDLDKRGISVSYNRWDQCSIVFDTDTDAEFTKNRMAREFIEFDKLSRSPNETEAAVADEMKKLTCKLADMSEEEMQRYIDEKTSNGGVLYSTRKDANPNDLVTDEELITLHKLKGKEYNEQVTRLARKASFGGDGVLSQRGEEKLRTDTIVDERGRRPGSRRGGQENAGILQNAVRIIANEGKTGGDFRQDRLRGTSYKSFLPTLLFGDGQSMGPQAKRAQREIRNKVYSWAEENGFAISEDEVCASSHNGKIFGQGMESRVYLSKDKKTITKFVRCDKNYNSMDECLDFFSDFNRLFSDAAYKVIGVSKDKAGIVRFVVEQPFIEGKKLSSKEYRANEEYYNNLIADGLRDRGLAFKNDCTFYNADYYVTDIYSGNVVLKDGKAVIIDANVVPRSKVAGWLNSETDGLIDSYRQGIEDLLKLRTEENEAEWAEIDKYIEQFRRDIKNAQSSLDGYSPLYHTTGGEIFSTESLHKKNDAETLEQHKSYTQSVIDSLGGKGKVVSDASELDHTGKKALRQNKDMAGYYDPKTGEVVVYLPNCHSRVDIERTVQHEKIGHEGLRGLLGKDRHKKFLQKVYLGLDEADRHIINEKMMRDGKLSLYNAVDEYLAEKAEVFNDSNRSLWQRVKDVWNDVMHGLGFKQSSTEKDIRTALWLSKNRLAGNDNSLEYRIRKAAFNSSLKKYHPTEATSRDGYTYRTNKVDEDGDFMPQLLYRTKNMSDEEREAALENLTPEGRDCLRRYNERLANWKYAWTEAHGDRLASVRELLDTILKPKKNEKIDSKYDIASKMEALGSKNQQEQEAFTRKYAKPIFKKLSELSTFFDGETPQERYRNLEAYAYVKHALERNRTLFVRDAIRKMEANDDPAIQAYSAVAQKDYDAERNRLLGELNKGNIDLRQFYSELDNYIANNIASFDAAHNDMSGLSDPDSETMKSLGISVSKKGEYNEDAALDYVMDSESKMGKSNVDEIWGMINEVSRGNVEREYNAGLINQKARDRMQSMFSWYLPLRGFDAKTSEEVYGYIGENGLSGFTANPKTKGRVSQAETPISTLLAMSDYSIFRSNKNEMKRSLVMLARDHQNNLITEYETWYHETVDASGNKVLEASYPELREDMTAAEIAKAIEDHEATISSKMESGETWVKLKDNKTNSPYRIVKQRQRNQHIVSCMIDGKQVDILIHGNPRAAQAINGLVHDTHWGAWDSVNHTLSQLMTSYSLSFMGRNKMRDLEYALASSLTENWKEGKQWNRNFAKMYAQLDFLNPLPTKSGKKEDMTGKYNDSIQGKINNMIKLFSLYRQGKLDMSNDVQRWFHEFVTNGGMTGFTSMIGRDDYDAQIQRTVAEYFDKKGSNKAIRLAQLSGEKATKLFSAYFNTVEKLNEAVENQTRFAAYCASRMERRSITRSVADAKDVSINFNRTGSGWSTHSLRTGEESTMWKINRDAAALTATYMRHTAWFYNAAIQGMVRNLKLFKDGDAAQRARFFVNMAALPMATYAVATLSSAAIAAALDGDDDKKKFGDNPLDQLPDYVRRQNFCLYTGHGRFIMIPLAIELRAMYGLADVCSRAGRGLPSEKGYGNELFEQFTQLTPYDLGGGSKVGTNGVLGSATGIVTPSNLQGLIACATNVKWTGGPVSGRSDWNASDAEWQRGLSTTSPFYVGMSRYLSTDFSNAMADAADKLGAHETAISWRGDDKGVKGGVVDINPAWAQYIVETYLGGPGKDFGEAASYLQSKASDVKEYGWSSITNDKGEADLTRTPIIKAFTRSATPNNAMATNRSRWYTYNKEYNDEIKPWIKGYAKNGESLDFKMLMASKKGQIGRVVAAYSPIIKQLQARKNAATTHAEREHAQWMMNDYINRAIEMIDKIEKK